MTKDEVEQRVKDSPGSESAVYFVFHFKDIEEYCVGATYQGHEWRMNHTPVAIFPSIELAFAFARILNQCGMAWLLENQHTVDVDCPQGKGNSE